MTEPLEDLSLLCVACGQPWTWTAGEQEWMRRRMGDEFNQPKRCKPCRAKRRAERERAETYGSR